MLCLRHLAASSITEICCFVKIYLSIYLSIYEVHSINKEDFLIIIVLLVFMQLFLLLVTVISLSLFFFTQSSSSCIGVSTQVSMLLSSFPSSFLNTCSSYMSFFRNKALCIVINFLVFWSIHMCSSFIYFKNDPEYPRKGTTQLFISLIKFPLQS